MSGRQTPLEAEYAALLERIARIVASVHGVLPRAMCDHKERLERELGLWEESEENPRYGPGNPDWEHDVDRERGQT